MVKLLGYKSLGNLHHKCWNSLPDPGPTRAWLILPVQFTEWYSSNPGIDRRDPLAWGAIVVRRIF